ncbi:exonuclease domain-containing protein [Pseudoalteromonas spongiae]|uniref:exonuclease domain-containing protein n=1 Tax=Pseudoalteromonas spongiae TaxID=298657 RepID=UPI000C2D5303|nr:exonuclease domain-containing protein [Pseudoalteromonas spongiae]
MIDKSNVATQNISYANVCRSDVMKELPEKYYLTHFIEFAEFIKSTSSHLLGDDETAFFAEFAKLPEDAQCILVRIVNRKSPFVRKDTLVYSEVADSGAAINLLRKVGFVSRISKHCFHDFIGQLNKQDLIDLSISLTIDKPAKSANKNKWLNFVSNALSNALSYDQVKKSPVLTSHIYFAKQDTFHYLLFLYFGHLSGRLNQFSMRDLGVMQTQSVQQQQANFSDKDEAKSAFYYANLFKAIKEANKSDIPLLQTLAEQLIASDKPIGFLATQKYHHSLYKLAIVLIEQESTLGETLLSQSQHPAAREKYIRLLYKSDRKAQCEALLLAILDDPDSETLLLFAEDFYAQKFNQKRTSVLTDMLKKSGEPIGIDEAYLGQVETGVKDRYIKQHRLCYFTENKLWRALFALTFWHELFQHPASQRANEFSYYPKVLKQDNFYDLLHTEIDHKLSEFTNSQQFCDYISATIDQYSGEPNGLFYWHNELKDVLTTFIQHAPFESIKHHLLAMSKTFKALCDGYPDLMYIEQGEVFFEEIKAPGDSLRRNQLVSIKQLINAGFNVSIQRTEWRFNSEQNYVVVDIETTGGKKDTHRITEIGMVRVEQGKITDSWQTLVNPERHIPKMITELTGISNEMVKDAPKFEQIAEKLDTFSRNAIFVAHNVNFDYGFIRQEFARLNKKYTRAKICTVQQARKYLPGFKSYSLGKLCCDLNIELKNHHRALDDAKAAAEILLRINHVRAEQ